MTKAASLNGKWRIVAMALWDNDFLDMMEPAYIAFDGKAGGEFAFGCVTGGLHCRKTPSGVDFTGKATTKWTKCPAMVGPNFKKTGRSKAKSVSITATTQPSRRADGEFFSSLLGQEGLRRGLSPPSEAPAGVVNAEPATRLRGREP
jgi:hypothetical protein